MKAIYLLDQSVNIMTAPDAWREKCLPVLDAAREITGWIIPKGTVVDGAEALLRVSTGQAAPFDEECANACNQSTAQLEATQRQYLAAEKGIKGKKDLELFMAGVILGYDEKQEYIHGPGWPEYQKALEKEEEL